MKMEEDVHAGNATGTSKERTQWSESEMYSLIRIWADHLSDFRHAERNKKVYTAITEELHALGITKTIREIKTKTENLGNQYR